MPLGSVSSSSPLLRYKG
ncbi:hypothetical protein F383_33784 [Gossypium arboreum]|uniref:Uncharacterized protein n=1 Tax=Gossypium arboreum TaxID=29729 RepID=A0A0B0PNJ4_GOSAR|nr:hypothetical protein F383_33784 [Gossypium arboreum]